MNKQLGPTLSTTTNGLRSCYTTVKRFAFRSVGTVFARIIHNSNNILNLFGSLFKNVNALTKRQENGTCLIFKRNTAHLTHKRTLRALIIASAKRLKSLLEHAKFIEHFVFEQYASPMRLIVLLSYSQSGVNALHIVIALNYFTFVHNVISVFVEIVLFALVKVYNLCKKKLIAV